MSPRKTLSQVFRWAARVVGMLILAFVLLRLVSSGLPKVDNISLGEKLLWGGFAMSLIGFALLWRWEFTGGIVALVGITLFYAANFALSGQFPGGWVLPIFFLPGFLSIACWLTEHQKKFRLR